MTAAADRDTDVPPAPPEPEGELRRAVRRVGLLLVVLDLGSLAFLLWRLELSLAAAIPLGAAVSFFTGYELQWRYLLAPDAYRAAGSKARFLAAAAVVVAVNLGASSLLVFRLWYPYLVVRIFAAALGAWAFARRQVRRVVG